MNLKLSNKTAMVCGGSQGLGLASAVELSLLGANVILVSRNKEKLEAAIGQLDTSKRQEHGFLTADFSEPTQVKEMIESFLQKGKAIDILINNTGGPAGGNILDAETASFEKAFQMHIVCNQILVQAITPGMKKEGFGRIINIISTSVKQPIDGLGVSNTIRAAVASWSKTLANELGPFGITVNNVLPGFTETERLDYVLGQKALKTGTELKEEKEKAAASIPARRLGLPHEFGAVVAFLSSPAASYINGINLPVDGGKLSCL